jgi:hypothetical protein
MKKCIFVLTLMLVSMLAIGCTENGNENNSTQASLQQPIDPENQDMVWMKHIEKYGSLTQSDMDNVGMAANISDYNLMKSYGQDLVNDTQSGLDENSNYTLSSKYQEAQNEWVQALTDLNSAGKYIVMSADECLAYGVPVRNLDYEQKIQNYTVSGTGHMNRANALLEGT